MTATNDLPARLREHAKMHDEWFGHRSPNEEQRQWAQDLREAAKDAERYRYLRLKFAIIENGGGRAEFQALNLPLPTYCAPHPACELDAAIDEAIGGK